MTCGLLTNPKGKLVVSGDSQTASNGKPDVLQLVGPIADYKVYVMAEVSALVAGTKAFTDAVKAGDWKAKALMRQRASTMSASSRLPNCSLTSTAVLTCVKMTSRKKRKTEIYRLPPAGKLLFADNTTKGADAFADQLYKDVQDLQTRVSSWPSRRRKWLVARQA